MEKMSSIRPSSESVVESTTSTPQSGVLSSLTSFGRWSFTPEPISETECTISKPRDDANSFNVTSLVKVGTLKLSLVEVVPRGAVVNAFSLGVFAQFHIEYCMLHCQ